MSNDIRVNFSDEEATSEARTFEPLPSGVYKVSIFKIEEKKVKEFSPDGSPNKNAGKPWWNIQLKVQEGDFDGRVLFLSVMLFEGAAYTLAQLLKACGYAANAKTSIKEEMFQGKIIEAIVVRKRDQYQERQQQSATPIFKNDVTGVRAVGSAEAVSSGGSGSLLP